MMLNGAQEGKKLLQQTLCSLLNDLTKDHWKALKEVEIDEFITSVRDEQQSKAADPTIELLKHATKWLSTLLTISNINGTRAEQGGGLQDLKESQELTELKDLRDLIIAIFYITLVLLINQDGCSLEDGLRSTILQQWIPTMVKFWRILLISDPYNPLYEPGTDRDWLEVAWAICSQCRYDSIPSTRLIIPIMARLISLYLPWQNNDQVAMRLFERHTIDIRLIREFTDILRNCLMDDDGAIRKQTLYIVKQLVKFNTVYLEPGEITPKLGDWKSSRREEQGKSLESVTRLFIWRPDQRELWAQIWKKFFLLYETVHETQVHILEPLLPILQSLVKSSNENETIQLPFEWWQVILNRAFRADSAAIRRRVLETVLSIDLNSAPALAQSKEFTLNYLLKALDTTSLYTTPPTTTEVSMFGMEVARFYGQLFDGEFITISEYLEAIRDNVSSATPALFLLQTLLQVKPSTTTIVLAEQLGLLKYFSNNTRLFHNVIARRLVRWQLLHVFLRLSDTSSLTFDQVANALTEFLAERLHQLRVTSEEYQEINTWLQSHFGKDYLNQGIAAAVQDYFLNSSTGELSINQMKRQGQQLATMLMFTLAQEGGFSQSVRPLYQRMALMGVADNSVTFVVASLSLFTFLNCAVREISQNQEDLASCFDVSSRLYEWISLLENILMQRSEKIPDLACLQILLTGMNLFLDKAAEERGTLIPYLDMLLFRLLEVLIQLETARTEQSAETFTDQVKKVVVLSLMASAFGHLSRVGNYSADFVDEIVVQRIIDLELERPSSLSIAQAEDWPELSSAFTEARWKLISTLAEFSRQNPTLRCVISVKDLFSRCLDALESASYRSVLAIFACMQVLVQISPLNEEIDDGALAESTVTAFRLLEEVNCTPVWYFLYFEAFIDYFFQPAILLRERWVNEEDSLLARVLKKLINLGERRKNLIPRLVRNLYQVWSTPEGRVHSLPSLKPIFIQLLTFGPIRESSEDRIAGALSEGNQEYRLEEGGQMIGSDYLVRVMMNSVLLRMSPYRNPEENGVSVNNDNAFENHHDGQGITDEKDHQLALAIVDDLLESVIK